jgi:hypothetical protein
VPWHAFSDQTAAGDVCGASVPQEYAGALTFAFVCVQILYPTYEVDADRAVAAMISAESGTPVPPPATSTTTSTGPTPAAVPTNGSTPGAGQESEVKGAAAADKLPPPDEEIIRVLRQVRLGHLLSRYDTGAGVCVWGGRMCVLFK